MRLGIRVPLLMVTFAWLSVPVRSADTPPPAPILERNVMVPMRDGIRLATDILRPGPAGKFPVILSRTPYRKQLGESNGNVRKGVATVVQDVRGRYASEGEFFPFIHEAEDGFDTIEWLAAQPWCDGNVTMIGGSYVGYTQLAAAIAAPPNLRAVAPAVPPSDFDRRTLFQGGTLRQSLIQGWLLGQSWNSQRVLRDEVRQDELEQWERFRDYRAWSTHLPLSDPGPIAVGGDRYAEAWTEYVDHWESPTRWRDFSPVERVDAIQVPVLINGGYYDIFCQGNIDLTLALRARGGSPAARRGSHLMLGPWSHGIGQPVGDQAFDSARQSMEGMLREWQACWVAANPKPEDDDWAAIYAYIIGQDRWVATDTWPPQDSQRTRVYLSPGRLSLEKPDSEEASSSFVYDPSHPVPTIAGNNLIAPRGIRDHRSHAARDDVLVFESEPLDREITLLGPLRARLFVSSDAPDTDFTAMLLDVRPDGYRANVQDGIVRLRYRHGRQRPEFVAPGQVVPVDVDLWSTGYAFPPGHRIALHVSSSNFPRFDRHLNTADPPWSWTEPRKARNTVYHDAERASYVELPVLP